ncbi:MAG TPA: isochorismatase family cysteine hydrolase [Gemmatimonadaceae bacterium]|nr:isochorismatase family cysteine hydrolase [Gemmatimonadaceae bacterium]
MAPAKNNDLHGSAPEKCPAALLMIDVINDLEFDGGEKLLEHGLPMAHNLAAFAKRARAAGIPVIYVNDNFGKWRSDFRMQLEHCQIDGARGKPIVELLVPDKDDYFVLKPKHSAFFATTLETLLDYLETKMVIITGLATDSCVLFTASDAHMRDLFLVVPEDCVAAQTLEEHEQALDLMRRKCDADTTESASLDLDQLLRKMTDT